jgi:hypothetical protein
MWYEAAADNLMVLCRKFCRVHMNKQHKSPRRRCLGLWSDSRFICLHAWFHILLHNVNYKSSKISYSLPFGTDTDA